MWMMFAMIMFLSHCVIGNAQEGKEVTACFQNESVHRWMRIPGTEAIANRVEKRLSIDGWNVEVKPWRFGEEDSEGVFHTLMLDFDVYSEDLAANALNPSRIIDALNDVLEDRLSPPLGIVRLFTRNSPPRVLHRPDSRMIAPVKTLPGKRSAAPPFSSSKDQNIPLDAYYRYVHELFTRYVYVVVYDPTLTNGTYLSDYLGWYEFSEIIQETIEFFQEASGGRLEYVIADVTIVEDWPVKIDGFKYDEETYLAVIRGEIPPHDPDTVDYNAIVNDEALDICGRANRGEIDEVWIFNGPYFGFYESTLVGPNAYWYNSPPVPEPFTCDHLVPIMGPSPERDIACAIHNFGHRMEATMTRVYGSWEQNSVSHNWNRFTLVKALSPSFDYSGCGNVHYPPNGTSDYDYSNTVPVLSNCDDFANYPDLGNPEETAQNVDCFRWGCDQLGYLMFWFDHLPENLGMGYDGVANDWWRYFCDPNRVFEEPVR